MSRIVRHFSRSSNSLADQMLVRENVRFRINFKNASRTASQLTLSEFGSGTEAKNCNKTGLNVKRALPGV